MAEVLIVSRATEHVREMERILEAEGLSFSVLGSISEVLVNPLESSPDIILVEPESLEEGPPDLGKLLTENEGESGIPVLVSAERSDSNAVRKMLSEGARDVFSLPIIREEFITRVRTHLGARKSRLALLQAREKGLEMEAELTKARQELEKSFRTDLLTGLPNRREMVDKLQTEAIRFERSGISFSLILCDIDDLKAINQRLGHEYGDVALKAVADVIVSGARKQDIVSRWSSEEFLLLLPETDLAGGKRLAEKIREELNRRKFDLAGEEVRITLTFGVTVFSESKSIESCLKSADVALSKGKRLGKNSVVVSTVLG